MANEKRIEDKGNVLRYLLRKGSLCNTYKIARALEMERMDVLEILNELAKENKVKLMHGSVRAITKELSEEEKIKTKSEVEELRERVEKLENWIQFTFSQLREAIQIGNQNKIKKNKPLNPEDIDIQKSI